MAELVTVEQARAAFWVAFREVAPEAFDELAELCPWPMRPRCRPVPRCRVRNSTQEWRRVRLTCGASRSGSPAGASVAEVERYSGRAVDPALPGGLSTRRSRLYVWLTGPESPGGTTRSRSGSAAPPVVLAPWFADRPARYPPADRGREQGGVARRPREAARRVLERGRRPAPRPGAGPESGPGDARKHARWAALCVAGPNEDGARGQSYSAILRQEFCDRAIPPAISTVSGPVQRLLKVLDLATPQRKGGRPRDPRP